MYKYEDISVNVLKSMLPSIVPKVLKKLYIIAYFQNAPIHTVEIQNPSLTTTHSYIVWAYMYD